MSFIGVQSDKFKNVYIADGEAHHPDSLKTICPTRWLTRLLSADARFMLVLQVVNVSWAYMRRYCYCFPYPSAYIGKRSLQSSLVHEMVLWA